MKTDKQERLEAANALIRAYARIAEIAESEAVYRGFCARLCSSIYALRILDGLTGEQIIKHLAIAGIDPQTTGDA